MIFFLNSSHISLKSLEKYEPKCYKEIVEKQYSDQANLPERLYFNKGL